MNCLLMSNRRQFFLNTLFILDYHKHIDSLQNTEVKNILQLQEKSRVRKREGVFLIEGKREIFLALEAGYSLQKLFVCNDVCALSDNEKLLLGANALLISISKEVYQKIAYRTSTEGIIAIAEASSHDLSTLKLSSNPLILVAEAPEKPGNIGAILRTADAANVDAVIIANPKTDLYNPNIIRSSVGGIFTTQVAQGTTEEVIAFLNQQQIQIYAAILQEAKDYTQVDFTQRVALVVGTEADGLSEQWRKASTQNIIIPMRGKIDSMNVSVAVGILLFEAVRQRK